MDKIDGIKANSLSGLQLGIRELFRIAVPGAYMITLLKLFWPQGHVLTPASESASTLLMYIFFIGLFGYALRVHERWWPYFITFEYGRAKLNKAICDVTGGEKSTDQVNLYKYFLETQAIEVRDRVHYFSSFYYMLAELSLASFAAAIALPMQAFAGSQCVPAAWNWVVTLPLALACGFQTCLLFGKWGIRGKYEKVLSVGPAMFLCLSLIFLFYRVFTATCTGPVLRPMTTFALLGLLAIGYAFFMLGAKHWTAIIEEQIVLVRSRGKELKGLYESYGASEDAGQKK